MTYISRGFSPNDRIGQDQQNLRDYPPILLPFLLLKRKSHNFLAVSIKKCIFAAGLTVARNLLAMGMSWTQIIQATGLTEDQLKQLQS